MEDEGNLRRRVLWASVLLLFVVVTAYFVFTYQPPIVLDRGKWNTVPYRQQAAEKMAASGQLLGLNEEQLRQELGNPNNVFHVSELAFPDSYTEWVWWYGLHGLPAGATDTLNLCIDIDRNGRSIRAYVRNKD